MPRKIIVNTSPLFYLHRLRCLDIFQKLYGEITVPEAVATELNIGRKTGEDVPQLGKYRWIKIEKVSVLGFIKLISDLGPGEAEVLALGCESKNSLVVIDDFWLGKSLDFKSKNLLEQQDYFSELKRKNIFWK